MIPTKSLINLWSGEVYLKFLLGSAIALKCFKLGKAEASTWSYRGATGTDFWGNIAPEFQTCSSGQAQSPINIPTDTLTNIEGSGFTLNVGSLDLNYQDTPLAIVNNGHTIRVDYQPGSTLTLDGEVYESDYRRFSSFSSING
jgi:carbonic anhydrase